MKLMLISPREEDKAFSLELAAQLGMEWESRQSIRSVGDEATESELLIDASAFSSPIEFQHEIDQIPDPRRVHLIAGPEAAKLSSYFDSRFLATNIVLRRFGDPWKAARMYSRALKASASEPRSGLERYGFPKRELHKMQLADQLQKGLATSATTQYLSEAGCQERLAAHISAAVDEILMNAVMDAPLGRSATSDEIANSGIKYPAGGPRTIDFEVGATADLFGFIVTDYHGTLNPRVAIRHLARAFGVNQDIRKTGTGAGLGLSLVFRSGASLVFLNDPGKRTEVAIFFGRTQSVKVFKSQFQFASFITSWKT